MNKTILDNGWIFHAVDNRRYPTISKHMLRIMKLLLVSIFVFIYSASASSNAQQVSIVAKETSFRVVMQQIKKQTGYSFAITESHMRSAKPISLNVRQDLKDVLPLIFENQPFGYKMEGKIILTVDKKREDVRTAVVADFQQSEISGRVVDTLGQPLAGVNIIFGKAKKQTFQTDQNGAFRLPIEADGEQVVFNFLGFQKHSQQLSSSHGPYLIKLKEARQEVDEVVVTGLFSRPTENFTGVATTISGDQLRNVNSMNALEAMKVFDPAIRMPDNLNFGSDPNRLPNISLRGTNNFPSQGGTTGNIPSSGADFMSAYQTNPSMPLFILDGFESSLQKISDLDINRIERITILKDAVATSAYGSRAANGVIVIDTKQPEKGRVRLNYTGTLQVTAPDLTSYNLLNASDKLELERISGSFFTTNPYHQIFYDNLYKQRKLAVESGVDTYWLSQPLRTGVGNKHALYVDGGDDYVRYGVNVGYTKNTGVMKGSDRNVYEGGMQLSYRKSNFLVRNQFNLTVNQSNNSPYGAYSQYTRLNPYWSPFDESGDVLKVLEVFSNPGILGQTLVGNPLYNASLGTKDFSKYFGVTNQTFLEWKFSNGLKLTGKLGLTKQEDQSDKFLPADHTSFINVTDYSSEEYALRGSYDRSNSSFFAYDASLTADYNKTFGKSLVFATLGAAAAEQNSKATAFVMKGFPNAKLDELYFGKEFLRNSRPTGQNNINRRVSVFSSIGYTYDKRYLVDFSFNTDGSTQFGSKNRFAPFWAVGLGWNVHEESFAHFLTDLGVTRFKIRGGIGTTGSQQFSPYMALSTYQYNTAQDYVGMFGATLLSYGNERLKWQQTQKLNLGADINFLKDWVTLRMEVYNEKTNDLLLDINTPPSLGVSSYKENVGKLKNIGVEGSINFFVMKNEPRSMFWSFFVNAIHNKNQIQEISNSLKKMNDQNDQTDNNLQTRPQLRFQEGQSVNAIWAVRSAGIDPSNGQELYIKKNGDLTYVWNAADKVIVGDAIPDLSGNWGTNFSYKGIQVGAYFSYQLGGTLYNQTLADRIENANIRYNVDERVLLGRWKEPGDVTFFKGLKDLNGLTVTTPTNATSRFVQKNNFMELESVSLGYILSDKITSRWKLSNTRFSLQANNLARISTIKVERGLDYPFARNFTFTINTSF
ncbi:SusC/RagA family TonB-linked outer membrane protein [Sphingobacterium faecale]|nr:SusC/RagA family TonB-linked outer membrane protein [Sphingobacterium faecale]